MLYFIHSVIFLVSASPFIYFPLFISYFSDNSSLAFNITQTIIYSIYTENMMIINITRALMQRAAQEQLSPQSLPAV